MGWKKNIAEGLMEMVEIRWILKRKKKKVLHLALTEPRWIKRYSRNLLFCTWYYTIRKL